MKEEKEKCPYCGYTRQVVVEHGRVCAFCGHVFEAAEEKK